MLDLVFFFFYEQMTQIEHFEVKPTPIENQLVTVFSPGETGMRWSPYWILDRRDDGAFRIKLHIDSPYDGLRIVIATQNDELPSVHPYLILVDDYDVDANGYYSCIYHHNRQIARTQLYSQPIIKRGDIDWVWVRFEHGSVNVGVGPNLWQSVFMAGVTPNTMGGGYGRFAVGKTQNNGAFELVHVQPMTRVNPTSRNRFVKYV